MAYLHMNLKSEAINQSVEFDVVLPALSGISVAEKPYKTLYFLTGFSGGARETLTFMNMQPHALLHGIALVVVTGDRSFYVDKPEWGENYGEFVGKELVEITRSLLPLSNKKEDTYIGGISMGGYGALINGLHYSNTFGKIALLSGGLDPVKIVKAGSTPLYEKKIEALFGTAEEYAVSMLCPETVLLDKLKKKEEIPELYLRCGRQDELVYGCNRDFLDFLKAHGIPVNFEESDGIHDLVYWRSMMESCFAFLSGKKEDVWHI